MYYRNQARLLTKYFKYQISCINSSTNAVEEKIVIPQRIERGATDILRALSATIKPDPTAAHFKYHDDPYLIPKSNMGKRTFAMAQESGRKAATWIRQQHPDLFQQTLADPPITAFLPQAVFHQQSEVTEDVLKQVINDVQVTDAITVYKLLSNQNVAISNETKQALLELLCFHNSEDVLNEELIEERWFKQNIQGNERRRKTWRDGDMAETLFKELDPPDAAAYCALIQGMAKYCQVENAWRLYEETQQKNIPLTVDVYNSLIKVVNFLREANDLRWKLVLELLTSMAQQKLAPNLDTLNAVLSSISTLVGSRDVKKHITSTLKEFQELGVKPSLASWYHILVTLSKDRA